MDKQRIARLIIFDDGDTSTGYVDISSSQESIPNVFRDIQDKVNELSDSLYLHFFRIFLQESPEGVLWYVDFGYSFSTTPYVLEKQPFLNAENAIQSLYNKFADTYNMFKRNHMIFDDTDDYERGKAISKVCRETYKELTE